METIFACGFNGFSQITSLTTQGTSSTNNKELCNEKILSPSEVYQLLPNQTLHNVLFTWDKIAIGLHTENKQKLCQSSETCDMTYVAGINLSTGHENSNTKTSHGCASYADSKLTASNDTDMLLTKTFDSNANYKVWLKDDGTCAMLHPFLKEQSSNLQFNLITGGHTDFFCIYDDINFGKMEPSENKTLKNPEDDKTIISLPIKHIDSNVCVSAVSCGKEHALLLSKHGSVYSYGLGSRGQLGHSTVESETSPRLIEALEGVPITCIAAGGWHSAAISKCGDLYTWGWNESGQLGLTSQTKSSDDSAVGIQAEPTVINLSADVRSVACGSRHTLCLTDKGTVLSCGWNSYGQLGHGHLQTLDKFTQLKNIKRVLKIFAGQWNSVFLVCNSISDTVPE